MNAPIAIAQLDRGVKRCADCAHLIKEAWSDRCGRSVKENYATGEVGHFSCEAERHSRLTGDCGQQAIHFTPSENYLAARSVRRMQNKRAIEDAITALNPDATDAQEILDAVTAAIKGRYEDNALAALEIAAEFRNALDEVEAPEAVPA